MREVCLTSKCHLLAPSNVGTSQEARAFLFIEKKKNTSICYQVVSVVSAALSPKAEGTRLLSAFSSRESCICMDMKFVFLPVLQLISNHRKI